MKRTKGVIGAAALAAVAGLVGAPQPVAAPTGPASVQTQGVTQRDNTAPPAQAVRAPSADRAILPLLPYMERRAHRWPIWTGGLRDSGFRARPVSRRGFRS